MAVEVALNTPLAEALSNVVQPKLSDVGWSTGGLDDSALGEYIILMLVNGKTQEQIAAELSNDLLSLGPDDTGATDFAKWLFEQVDILNGQLNGHSASQASQAQQGQAIPSYIDEESSSRGGNRQPNGGGGGADVDIGEAMDGVQNGAMYVFVIRDFIICTSLKKPNRPTGPKSMRNPSRNGNKRMIGQISKAMDRSGDAALHRVRAQQGTERISMHGRLPPKGPRTDQNRIPRAQANGRPISIPNGNMPNGGAAGVMMTPQQHMQWLSIYEEQVRMMQQLFSPQQQHQQLVPAIHPAFHNGGTPPRQQQGRSLFERVEGKPQRDNGHLNKGAAFNGGKLQSQQPSSKSDIPRNSSKDDISSSMEVETSQNSPPALASETICRFNLTCTKKDCPYAHQSPEAPPGTTIDVHDECPFGAACKNRKCVGRHPSPAQKISHQSEQDCRFFPHCTNPSCPFRHPTAMPPCKFGADCKKEGCKFTHVKTMCRFNPCLNPQCPFKHAEGQKRGVFGDKVWRMADEREDKGHVSERKFVDEVGEEELVVPDVKLEDVKAENQQHGSQSSSLGAEVVT